ncbi:hypothetical protein DFP73DRAFT_588033 [Morchella snyderi]|nr:hypothetical protein DFP73DRAFT_588033 [Morchella snyderi]
MTEHPLSGEATTLLLSEGGVEYGTCDTVASTSNLGSVRTNRSRTLDIIQHDPLPTINSRLEAWTEPGNSPPNDEKLALRISNIPASVSPEQLAKWLNNLDVNADGASRGPKRQRMDNIHTISLAPSPSSDSNRYQVATVNFRKLPSEIKECRSPSTSLAVELGEEESRFSALFDSHFEGLTPLNNPKSPALDIIAVTGLAGHAFGSWRSPDGPEMWLRDFVPKDLEHSARILTYGYNSTLATESSKVRIGDLATSFLEALKRARSQKGTTERPIIFIGHSLGGVVIKKALRKADCTSIDSKDIHADILRSCHGILFFGVPNLTLEITNLREMVKGKPNNHLVEDLGGTSQFLETLGEEFYRYFKQRPTKIICFHELKDTSTVQFNRTKNKWERSGAPLRMVAEKSAIHPPTLAGVGLDADHSSMVKYKSVLEQNYKLVMSELSGISAGITLGPPLVLLDSSQRETILQWLSKIEYKKHHATAKETILDKTGQWLLNKKEFRDWRSSSASSILWLHGIPGAGKTKLVSAVIDYLNFETTRHEPIVYFYCSRNDPSRRNSVILMRSMVKQLSLVYPHLPQSVVEEYNRRKEDGFAAGLLDFEESQDLLISLLGAFPQTTIVIDALDENDVEERLRLLGAIQDILRRTSGIVRIFVASRDDQDITLHLEHVPNLFIKAEDNRYDIERFIHREVEDSINTRRLLRGHVTAELKKKIISVIVNGAKEMFQWANLQIKQLYSLNLEEDVWDNLGRLPKTLEETYSQIIHQISSQTPREQEYVKRALMWIMSAETPLNRDLWAALSFYPKPVPRDGATLLFGLCNNLVTFDQELGRVVFAHLSVEEYLEKTDTFSSQNASRMALEACLYAYNHDPAGLFMPARLDFYAERVPPTVQLARYCIIHWPYHAEHCYENGMGNDEVDLIQDFLGTPKEPGERYLKWINLVRVIPQGLPWVTDLWYKHRQYLLSTPPNPIFLLPCFSFGTALQTYWKSSILNIDSQNDMGHTPLLVATFQGNELAMSFLLENGADVNAKRGFPAINTLMAAIISHKPKTLFKLIAAGANISANSCNYKTVLEAAAREGEKDTVKSILSTTRNTEISEDVLKAAAGNPTHGGEIMTILVDKRPRITQEVMEIAANNPNGRDIFMILCANYPRLTITEEVLVVAARNFAGTLILETLLSEFPDTEISQAIFIAAAGTYKGNETTRILLNKYPNIEITDSTIRAASKHSFPRSWEVMQMLLSRRAKILYDPEDIFCGIVENCYSSDTLHMLLTISPKFDISRDMMRAIDWSEHPNKIKEILEFHGLMREKIMLLSVAAEGNDIYHTRVSSWPEFPWPLSLVVPLSSAQVPQLSAASAAHLANEYLGALEDTHPGCEMMNRLLSSSYGLDFFQLILEVTTESKGGAESLTLLLKRYPELQISETVLNTAIKRFYPEDVMDLLLSRCPGQLITESVLIKLTKKGFGGVKGLLARFSGNVITEAFLITIFITETDPYHLYQGLIFVLCRFPNIMISQSVLNMMVDILIEDIGPFVGDVGLIRLLLGRNLDLVIDESTLIAAVSRSMSTEIMKLLLGRCLDVAVTEAVLIAAADTKDFDKLRFLLARCPDMATEAVLIAAVRSYDSDELRVLLERFPDVAVTEAVLVAAADTWNFDKLRVLLERCPGMAVTEAVLIAATGSGGPNRLGALLDRCPDTSMMTQAVLIAAADTKDFDKLRFLLARCPDMATEAVLIAAVRSYDSDELRVLLERFPDVAVTEAVLVAAADTWNFDKLRVLLDRCPGMAVTEAVLIAAVRSYDSDELWALLDRFPAVAVTEAVLVAAVPYGSDKLRVLLDRCPDVAVTEAVLIAAVRSYYDSDELRVLLDRCPDVAVTEAVLIAAVPYGSDELRVLLDGCPDVAVTEAVLIAAVSYGSDKLRDLLDRCPDVAVTEAVLIAAVRSYYDSDELRVLLDRCPDVAVTEAVLIAAVPHGSDILRVLLDRCPDVAVTEAVLIAAVRYYDSDELRVLLDRCSDVAVTEAVLIAAVRSYDSDELRVLLDRCPDVAVTEAALIAAVPHGSDKLRVLLDGCLDVAVTEAVLIDAVPYGSDKLRVLLDRCPDVAVTEAVLIAAVPYASGELRVLLDRCPDVAVTEAVLIAAVPYASGELRVLLDRCPDVAVTEAVLIAAVRFYDSDELRVLLDRCSDVAVTEAVLIAAVPYASGELRVLLDRCPDVAVTEAVLTAAVRSYYDSDELRVLLDRCPDVAVTEAVLIAAVSYYDSDELRVLLDRCPDVVVTEAVLIAAVRSYYDSDELRVLLDRCPDVAVTEAVLIAAVPYGSDELRVLLERCPDVAVTEAVLIAAVPYGSDELRDLLDRCPDVVVTKLVLRKIVENKVHMETTTLERIMDKYPEPTIGQDPWTTSSNSARLMKLLLARRSVINETPSAGTCIPPQRKEPGHPRLLTSRSNLQQLVYEYPALDMRATLHRRHAREA